MKKKAFSPLRDDLIARLGSGVLKFHRPFRALFGRAEISAEL
jgi:hypothetical protein